MKAIVITGSRADRNCQEMVHEALLKAGHDSTIEPCDGRSLLTALEQKPDVAVVAGDRIEVLCATFALAADRIPICHISGGDVTEGSADDRYRDAITALSCIHCAETDIAFNRLTGGDYVDGPLIHKGDKVYLTGNPAIDRIKQTPLLSKEQTLSIVLPQAEIWRKTALVCVHPNTAGSDPMIEADAVYHAMMQLKDMAFVCIGANADPGGEAINVRWRSLARDYSFVSFSGNVSSQLYYSLMAHCDVMVGNSSAMLTEAPCFGLPCVLVGERQRGRRMPNNVYAVGGNDPLPWVKTALERGRFDGTRLKRCENPYGDGNSASRIIEALEENAWRWSGRTSGASRDNE